MATLRRREGFLGCERSGYPWAHLSEGNANAVDNQEEGKDKLYGPDHAVEDKVKNASVEEAECHCLGP